MKFTHDMQLKEVATLVYRHGLAESYDVALATVLTFEYDSRYALAGMHASNPYADDVVSAEEAQCVWDSIHAAHLQMLESV